MQVVVRKKTSNQFLVNKVEHTAIEIADIYGCVKCFTSQDVLEAESSESSEEIRLYSSGGNDVKIGDFRDGVASFQYIIQEAGYMPFDEDGYGFEEWSEESLFGFIDKNGKIVGKLH